MRATKFQWLHQFLWSMYTSQDFPIPATQKHCGKIAAEISISGLVATILDVRRPLTSDSSSNSILELLDLESIGVAVGISMLSGLQAEFYVSPYPIPVNGRHLSFPTSTNIVRYPYWSHCIAGPRKHGYSRWNFVAIMYTSQDKRYFIITSSYSPPPLINRTVIVLVQSCCLTPKTWV